MQRELVIRAIGGDFDAFSSLVRTSTPRQYAIATLILRDGDRAQDAVQEALVSAWKGMRALRDPDAWDAWLHRLTVRACYQAARSQRRRTLVELHVTPDREPPGATGLGTVPVFSPDGKTFIVTAVSHQPGPVMGQLVVASADGRRPAVAIGPAYSYQDRQSYGFSPDGTKVILDLASGASWMLDVAGGNGVQVKQFLSDPSWQRRAP